jgi:hypothetical protein
MSANGQERLRDALRTIGDMQLRYLTVHEFLTIVEIDSAHAHIIWSDEAVAYHAERVERLIELAKVRERQDRNASMTAPAAKANPT